MKGRLILLAALLAVSLWTGLSVAATPYDIGSPTITELFVDPGKGNNLNTGARPDQALRTINEAWNRIPDTMTTTGYRINLLPGVYPCQPGPERVNCINYFSNKTGTHDYPVIIRATEGPNTVTIRGGFNFKDVRHLYLIDLNLVGGGSLPTNISGNNLLHLEGGDHVLLRRLSVVGPAYVGGNNNLQEVLKVNQTQYLFVEDSTIGGAWHSSVDYMVVHYGHFLGNKVHTAGQWCMYMKGGTSHMRIEGNEFGDKPPRTCYLGMEVGQAANFAMMTSPWLHYDTYDIKVVNNVFHDIPGTGVAVAGGYNTLVAYNTFYKVATSTGNGYSLFNAWQAERGCSPTDDLQEPAPQCHAYTVAGGWGPTGLQQESIASIPNRNVYAYNNLFHNPAPTQTLYAHLNIRGPIPVPAGFANVPDPVTTDDNLSIRGSMIWNGNSSLPLGIEDTDQGCQPANETCNATQLRAENRINVSAPQLVNPERGDFHPVLGGTVFSSPTFTVPDFTGADIPTRPAVPVGTLSNAVPVDRDGRVRTLPGPPGAYSGAAPCAYTVSPTAWTFGPSGGTGTIAVVASSSDCKWTAATDDLWLRITSGGSATGNGTIGYTVDSFSFTGQRTGRIRIGKTVFTVTQKSTPYYGLTVTTAGNGKGTVASSPAGISCGNGKTACAWPYKQNQRVTLTAAVKAGESLFAGWAGACTNTRGPCVVTMTAAKSVTATFTANPTIVVAPPTKRFGNVRLTRTAIATFTIKNTLTKGSADLHIGNISRAGSAEFSLTPGHDNCSGKTIAAGRACTFQATFAPTTRGVNKAATLTIPSDGAATPTTVSLYGNGI